MGYPRILRIRQQFDRPRVADIAATVSSQLERLDLGRRIRPGQSVALTAGSRGIANIPLVLKATADFKLGAKAKYIDIVDVVCGIKAPPRGQAVKR